MELQADVLYYRRIDETEAIRCGVAAETTSDFDLPLVRLGKDG